MPGAWALCSYPHVSTHPVIHRTQVLELQPHGEHPFTAGNYNPLPQRGLQSKSQFYFPCVGELLAPALKGAGLGMRRAVQTLQDVLQR